MTTTLESLKKEILEEMPLLIDQDPVLCAALIDRTIGALGAGWGMQAERTFRNALAGILEKNFGVEVIAVTEYDAAGGVFGRPDQVELDGIIKNGLRILCGIKSSMLHPAARAVGKRLGIEMYSDSIDVPAI